MTTKKDGWRDNMQKSKAVKYTITEVLDEFKIEDPTAEEIFNIVKNQRDY